MDGAPPIGWHDASAYLVLPVLLVVSQYIAQKIISPPSDDPSQQSSQWILKFLPLMIGELPGLIVVLARRRVPLRDMLLEVTLNFEFLTGIKFSMCGPERFMFICSAL